MDSEKTQRLDHEALTERLAELETKMEERTSGGFYWDWDGFLWCVGLVCGAGTLIAAIVFGD